MEGIPPSMPNPDPDPDPDPDPNPNPDPDPNPNPNQAAALLESQAGLSLPARPMLATSFCFLREAHADYGWWRYHWARALVGGPSHYRRGPLLETTFKTFAWLATRQVYEAMKIDALTGER